MRVIGGCAKGRKLLSPKSTSGTRPITDRAKESLFNILNPVIVNSRFLDLFAGTGSVGIEALSRGALSATFVERERAIVSLLKKNLRQAEVSDDGAVFAGDVFQYLSGPAIGHHIIFIAPPQYHELWSKTLVILDDHPEWLASDGIIVVQIDPSEYRRLELATLVEFERRKYSNVYFCFYRKI